MAPSISRVLVPRECTHKCPPWMRGGPTRDVKLCTSDPCNGPRQGSDGTSTLSSADSKTAHFVSTGTHPIITARRFFSAGCAVLLPRAKRCEVTCLSQIVASFSQDRPTLKLQEPISHLHFSRCLSLSAVASSSPFHALVFQRQHETSSDSGVSAKPFGPKALQTKSS